MRVLLFICGITKPARGRQMDEHEICGNTSLPYIWTFLVNDINTGSVSKTHYITIDLVGAEVFTAVSMKNGVFWDVTP
jgi:hypothetical protein